MPDPSTFRKFVEVGRVVLLKKGPHAGKTATIVEIIDHNRALIDGPTTGVPRQSFPYRHLVLTTFVVKDLPRAAGTPVVKKYIEKSEVDAKWAATSWAKRREIVERRKKLSDFERFKVMLGKRQRRDKVRKTVCSLRKN
ncbi:probable RPL14B-ribosomal protein [Serendipita indica DSM 11827]|uniref:Probable RPL14B-ribosomal protein n=1 Tax=Serendipita indica (strain DSM 11827) TaxID=1109443 RepID=G4TMA8_SERID|nr:probable RPL14B-ribosomal protein [Serendipita indica DSM 11827]